MQNFTSVFQLPNVGLGEGLCVTLGSIQKLAERIICHLEDMQYVDGRPDLMRLPIALLPKLYLELELLLYEDENIVCILFTITRYLEADWFRSETSCTNELAKKDSTSYLIRKL